MRFRDLDLPGPVLVELEPHVDERGFFARAFAEEEFGRRGLPMRYPHWNLSRNSRAGTLRGVHYNAAPALEAKIVRCSAGAIWDVVVDIRAGSPTRLRWIAVELSADRGEALYVPEGFAHGFITLTDGCDVLYQMSRTYVPDAARGLRWNDPLIGIRWPRTPVVMSDQDRAFADFDEKNFDG